MTTTTRPAIPLTPRGILPAFHCPHCNLRHATPAIAVACFRAQTGL